MTGGSDVRGVFTDLNVYQHRMLVNVIMRVEFVPRSDRSFLLQRIVHTAACDDIKHFMSISALT